METLLGEGVLLSALSRRNTTFSKPVTKSQNKHLSVSSSINIKLACPAVNIKKSVINQNTRKHIKERFALPNDVDILFNILLYTYNDATALHGPYGTTLHRICV